MGDYREEMRVGKQILARVVEAYRKIRNTCATCWPTSTTSIRRRDLVARGPDAGGRSVRAGALRRRSRRRCCAPTSGTTSRPSSSALNGLTTVDLSAFYVDVSKDRLYTFGAASPERRSAQTAMYLMADGLARLLAPILPVTADEMWRHLPGHARRVGAHGRVPPRPDLERLARRRAGRRGGSG